MNAAFSTRCRPSVVVLPAHRAAGGYLPESLPLAFASRHTFPSHSPDEQATTSGAWLIDVTHPIISLRRRCDAGH